MTASNVATVSPRRRSALWELSVTGTRELLRDPKNLFGLLIMFFFYFAIMVALNYMFNYAHRPHLDAVSVTGGDSISHQLTQDGFQVIGKDNSAYLTKPVATVHVSDDSATITLATPNPPRWIALARAVHETGIPYNRITVIDADGTPEFDWLRLNLSTVLASGILGIVFYGTAIPVVTLRDRGTLRFLGTTPVKRTTFIIAQCSFRMVLCLIESIIVVVVALSLGYVGSLTALRLLVTLILGITMLFSCAFLIASRAKNANLVAQITGFLPVLVVYTGTIAQFPGLPKVLVDISNAVPSTWFMQAIGQDLSGTTPFTSIYLLWLFMAAATFVAGYFATKLFRWDQGDHR